MIDQTKFFESLKQAGVKFITGVPDSLLNDFCLYLETNMDAHQHVITANEGSAIGLATGYYLATQTVPLVYMQNSGVGNAMNPLLSLTHQNVFSIPMVLLIGWRGEPGSNDWAQHKKQGELTPVLLNNADIPYKVLEEDQEQCSNAIEWAVATAKEKSGPTALLVKKGVLAGSKSDDVKQDITHEMTRGSAIEFLLKHLPQETLYVATTGRATRELFHLRNDMEQKHSNDFLNVGAMGHTSQIATGIALGAKDRKVVCLDGDAATIMHMGSLLISASLKPSNFLHVILNNGAHESVGGQTSLGQKVNFTSIAEEAGYTTIGKPVKTERELKTFIDGLEKMEGPVFVDIHVRKGMKKGLPPLKFSHLESKEDFIQSIANHQ